MHDSFASGNGNGNKMNLRVEILENLLQNTSNGGTGTSAKINSLRQAIRRNKADMADNTKKSLDVLRQVFQHEMTDEIRQIIDRHVRTTFTPAFENLRRNGHDVSQSDIDELCVSILDGAKEPFLPNKRTPSPTRRCIPSASVLKNAPPDIHQMQSEIAKLYESDEENESDASSMTTSSAGVQGPLTGGLYGWDKGINRPKKRGRPRKTDVDSGRSGTPLIAGTQPVTATDAAKWNPERILKESRFILASKVNKALATGHRGNIFSKHPRAFRYVADDEDKAWLFDRNISTRMSGKVYFMMLEDAVEIARLENAPGQAQTDLQRYSFPIPEKIAQKIKLRAVGPFEQLKNRVVIAGGVTQPLANVNFQNFI
ncbi:suppressor of activated egl-4 protein 2 [Ditylenchus destructor]|uniref:Suppressor of activated egl-4 protein 2 n=1 Tax=Ditylenchus destructor TaxID=166010 RepID=A0AAD4NM60_9BILA|nr:suppressor of activated egl-4 protein 2 [Ditylenchus destructor]